MNESSMVTNLYRQLKALKVRIWALSVHCKPHDQQAIFPRKTMNRFVLAVVFVMVLPILACHHSVAHAQSDPLNNSYMPSVDCNPADYPSNIRLSGDMDKLMQTSGSPSTLASASVCQTIYGTQNEWVDFQLHVRAPAGGYPSLNVSISPFTKSLGPGGSYTISNSYRQIIPYAERYLDITSATAGSGNVAYIISGSQTGYVPDILVPFLDPYYNQTTNANPEAVTANNNQSYWFDILIPAAAPSGWYSGTVTISNGGTTLATMPVLLGVWQWPSARGGAMPSTPSLPVMENATNEGWNDLCLQYYGSYSACSSFPGAAANSDKAVWLTESQLAVLFLDHRMSYTVPTYPPNQNPASSSTWYSNWSWLLNGTNPPTPVVTPMLSGAKDQAVSFYFSSGGYTNPGMQNWLTAFNSNGWYSNFQPLFYPVDEPGTTCSNWTALENTAAVAHGDSPSGQILVTGTIEQATGCSVPTSDVDIFVAQSVYMDPPNSPDEGPGCSVSTYPYCLDRASYNAWQSTGSNKIVASYFGCSNSGTCGTPGTGNPADSLYNINADGTGVSNREEEWMTWLHNESAELYFADTLCWEGTTEACAASDPWTSILHYGNNGDGTTVYEGTNAKIGVSTPVVLPSIRLELRRDGIQDYEYMHLLGSQGQSALVTSDILTWALSSQHFNNNPVAAATGYTGDITDARFALGSAVHQLTYPVSLLPPTNVTVTIVSP